MALIERLFGRLSGPPALPVKELKERIIHAAVRLDAQPLDQELTRARLADRCRDAGLVPITPEEFESLAAGFDDEARRRLAVLVEVVESDDVLKALASSAEERSLADQIKAAFFEVARSTPLLTLELLRQSQLRAEELARKFMAGLGVAVAGESSKVSGQRLERLDYAKLLAEAERAKAAAEKRMEKLHEMQDQQEQNRTRRGKW